MCADELLCVTGSAKQMQQRGLGMTLTVRLSNSNQALHIDLCTLESFSSWLQMMDNSSQGHVHADVCSTKKTASD